jgi:hypothetical protein
VNEIEDVGDYVETPETSRAKNRQDGLQILRTRESAKFLAAC